MCIKGPWPLFYSTGFFLVAVFLSGIVYASSEKNADASHHVIAIDRVWSGNILRPALLTENGHQFVAYYDTNRQMSFAGRKLGEPWRYHKVDSWAGWDSHNYVTMALDEAGYLHVSGNMHNDRLQYFRSTHPYDVRSLMRVKVMADVALEEVMTYPAFIKSIDGVLFYKYRDGGSGNGQEIYNVYDPGKTSWARLHNSVFLDGEGKMNAYFDGPILGPDKMFHLAWVWRDTPDAATNNDLSYARSKDLIHWENSHGLAYTLPIRLSRTQVVDPVPARGGMINGNTKLGFGKAGESLIAYHKFDAQGNSQVYVARPEGKSWKSIKISSWKNFRWEFGGGGSLAGTFRLKLYPPRLMENGHIGVLVRKDGKVTRFVLDPDTLKTLSIEAATLYPQEIVKAALSVDKSLRKLPVHVMEDSGEYNGFVSGVKADVAKISNKKYYLTWRSLPANRDEARKVIPPAGNLLLHTLEK